MADIGGIMGLTLGLSLLQILVFLTNMYRYIEVGINLKYVTVTVPV